MYVLEEDLREVHAEEDITVALATYQAVRDSLRTQKNQRGYFGKGKGAASSKGSSSSTSHTPPTVRFRGKGDKGSGKFNRVRVHIDVLKLRTKCARCGQVGHWARECVNPPDARGSASAAARAGRPGTGGGAPNFFTGAEGPAGGEDVFFEFGSKYKAAQQEQLIPRDLLPIPPGSSLP